jgi:hypothetical protein
VTAKTQRLLAKKLNAMRPKDDYVSDKHSTVTTDGWQRAKRRQQLHHVHVRKELFCASKHVMANGCCFGSHINASSLRE